MSESAQKSFVAVATALGPLLDQYSAETSNQTLLSLEDLGQQLPLDSSLRQTIEQQMARIISSDFHPDPTKFNETLVLMATIKERLADSDPLQQQIDAQMAKALDSKFDAITGLPHGNIHFENPTSQSKTPVVKDEPPVEPEPEIKPEPLVEPEPVKFSAYEPETKPEETPAVAETPLVAPAAEELAVWPDAIPDVDQPQAPAEETVAPIEEPAAPADDLAEAAHKLQLALDQMPVATRQAFPEFKPVENSGTVNDYVGSLRTEYAGDAEADAKIRTEINRLLTTAERIDDAPAEADQFQVLYDQVDAKHKDAKNGVFSIFQREYGGNARRFVVERTAQYAKYVPADESRQRMVEDLHKLIDQAQKSLKDGGKDAKVDTKETKSGGRAFFHG